MRTRPRHRRTLRLLPHEQAELAACILLAAIIVAIVGTPIAYYLLA